MGKVYKNKRGSSCKMCKPHKNGWEPKHKKKYRQILHEMNKRIKLAA